MNDFYSQYKSAHDAAYECLTVCNVQHLPVNVADIVEYYSGKIIFDQDVKVLKPREEARLLIDDGTPTIIIRPSVSPRRMRFSVAHELGHFLLNHPPDQGQRSRTTKKCRTDQEREADAFAAALLAPACVLISLKITDVNKAADIFRVSREAAKIRINQVKYLYHSTACVSAASEVPVLYNLLNDIKHIKNNNLCLHAYDALVEVDEFEK